LRPLRLGKPFERSRSTGGSGIAHLACSVGTFPRQRRALGPPVPEAGRLRRRRTPPWRWPPPQPSPNPGMLRIIVPGATQPASRRGRACTRRESRRTEYCGRRATRCGRPGPGVRRTARHRCRPTKTGHDRWTSTRTREADHGCTGGCLTRVSNRAPVIVWKRLSPGLAWWLGEWADLR
jgi:hypothetical protein